ncbi:MAG: ACP phosphodiesterase [Taibaiella sp.]|nr:ACP phosphodiesterase [Taibaiella sp.]
MNYLGHAFLSFGDSELITGNMIGDHVKGKLALDLLPPVIKKGIELHRKIDQMTDSHPASLRAGLLFRSDYGRYSGAIMDTLFDHFLANDPKHFPSQEDLLQFTQSVYNSLSLHQQYFPVGFAAYYPHMVQHNWLFNYRNMKGIEKSLHGLANRAKYIPPINKAYEIFVTNYYQLNQCYYDFIDDMIKFAKTEIDS